MIIRIKKRLQGSDFVDDTTFASEWVEGRREHKGYSRIKLISELKSKRISDEIIAAVLLDDSEDDLKAAKLVIKKKQHLSRLQDEQKLKQYLARQGFNYGIIKQALEQITEEDAES